MEDLISTGQASRLIGISQPWLRRLIHAGQLEAVETPLGALLRREDVEAYAERRSAQKEKITA